MKLATSPRSLSAPLTFGMSVALVAASLTAIAVAEVASAPAAEATNRITQQSGFNARAWTVTSPDSTGTRYVGGDFTSYKAWNTGVGGVVDATSAAVDPTFPSVSAWPYADVVVPDGTGGWYVGGGINNVGGSGASGVAHINADGSVDTAWTPSVAGGQGVFAMAKVGNAVLIGGSFTSVDGQPRTRLAALDATTGDLLDWAPVANSTVHTMTASGDTVYIGGQFTQLAGQSRSLAGQVRLGARTGGVSGTCLDAWNDADCLTGWDPQVGGWGVKSIATDGTDAWLAGAISSIGGQARGYLGRVDATTGLVDAWNPALNSEAEGIALDGTTLYVGGLFTDAGGTERNRLAAYDTTTDTLTSWNPNVSGNTVKTLQVVGSTVYVGGQFTAVGGLSRFHAAAISTSGAVQSWDPHVCNQGNGAPSYVYGLSVASGKVYLIGDFPCMGGLKRTHAAAVGPDGLLTSWAPVINGPVFSFSRLGSTIYMAGNFSSVNGTTRTTAAAVDASGTLTAWDPAPAGDRATDVLATPSRIYISGFFGSIGGTPARGVAVVDPTTGALDGTFDPQLDGPVRAMWLDGSRLFVGGDFSTASGENHVHIASLDATTGAVNSAFTAGVSDGYNTGAQIEALAVIGQRVYLGGYFQKVNGVSQRFAAAVDATTGVLDTGWNPTIGNWVFALAPSSDGSTVFIAGDGMMVTSDAPGAAFGAAEVDAVTGDLTAWRGDTQEVRGISVSDAAVFLAGSFSWVGGQSRSNTAAVDRAGNVLDPWPMDPATSNPLVVSVTGSAPGAVVSAPGGINCGESCTYAYSSGSSVTLTAVPAQGASFDGWSGACTGSVTTCTVAMSAAQTAVAEFTNSAPGPNPSSAPTAPRSVTAVAGDSRATVSWQVPASAGSAAIEEYEVTSSPAGGSCTATAPATRCRVDGLVNGTEYTFTVRARNSVGWSPASDASSPVTPQAGTGPGPGATIMISGSRVTGVMGGRQIRVRGTAEGLVGERLTVHMRVGSAKATFRPAKRQPLVKSDSTFTWKRKMTKRAWIYVSHGDVTSERIRIRAR